MTIKQIFQVLCITLLLIVTQACNSKKEPFQYYSFCEAPDYPCGDKNKCGEAYFYEGKIRDKSKCQYFKIPTNHKSELDSSRSEINTSEIISTIFPEVELDQSYQDRPYREANITNIGWLKFSDELAHVRASYGIAENSSSLEFNMRVFEQKYYSEIQHFIMIPKDSKSYINCLTTSHSRTKNPRASDCAVTSYVDDTFKVKYYIPFSALGKFEEINQAYNQLVRSYLVNTN